MRIREVPGVTTDAAHELSAPGRARVLRFEIGVHDRHPAPRAHGGVLNERAVTEPGFWMRLAMAGIAATSEATFPENDLGAPDWKSTAMVERTLEYFDELPPRQRRLLVLLFVFTELAAGLLSWRLSRFSRLPARHRTWAIHCFRRSELMLLRVLGDALKATATMMYMSHPLAIGKIFAGTAEKNQ